nr:hypothetical protein CFP56_14975 [Quercus suber]
MEGKIEEKVTDLGRFGEEKSAVKPGLVEGMQWETASCQVPKLIPDGRLAPQFDLKVKEVGPGSENPAFGPLALSFDDKKGWITKTLGLTSKHWKRLARENNKQASQVSESPTKGKRDGPTPLQELDPNSGNLKRRKGRKGGSHDLNGEDEKVGEIHDGSASSPWRATGFYGQPDAAKSYISWELTEVLKIQSSLPWVVFGDFNEISHSDEKSGGLERDAGQMKDFRECLSRCGLFDLGYVEQRHTWCNGRAGPAGEQRTKLRLDRVVASRRLTSLPSMAEELEELWKKLTFTEEEDMGIQLDSRSTSAARKISEIEEELFLVEFGDEKDKKKVLDMCPWSYEKQLILIQEYTQGGTEGASQLQCGAWLTGEPMRRGGKEVLAQGARRETGERTGIAEGRSSISPEQRYTAKEQTEGGSSHVIDSTNQGKVKEMEGKIEEKVTDLGRFGEEKSAVKPGLVEGMQWETASCQVPKLIPDGSLAPQFDLKVKEVGPGLTSKHWKRLARENNKQASQVSESPTKGKRDGPTPLQELDPNSGNLKRGKGSKGGSHDLNGEDEKIHDGSASSPWRATGFYGQPNAAKSYISWELMEVLKIQSSLPWVVFGDFNEISHSDEKSGGLERDAGQMKDFRECLSRCGLFDLGYVEQRHTWCNGRAGPAGEQRTKLRLDRVVASESWIDNFPEASVHHVSMSISDHCLLSLFLHRRQPCKPARKRFLFEAMWIREAGCREVIEEAWDPLGSVTRSTIMDRIKVAKSSFEGGIGGCLGTLTTP